MNGRAKNVMGVVLGMGLGLLALVALSGGYAVTNMEAPMSSAGPASGPPYAISNPGTAPSSTQATIANIANPIPNALFIVIITAVSILIAMGAGLGISRRIDRYT